VFVLAFGSSNKEDKEEYVWGVLVSVASNMVCIVTNVLVLCRVLCSVLCSVLCAVQCKCAVCGAVPVSCVLCSPGALCAAIANVLFEFVAACAYVLDSPTKHCP
jgi:hypothetical protein